MRTGHVWRTVRRFVITHRLKGEKKSLSYKNEMRKEEE